MMRALARWSVGSLILLLVAAAPALGGEAPWLGVELGPGSRGGVGVRGVLPGSPAERAGVRAGEEVLAVGERKVTTGEELVGAVLAERVGARVALRLDGGPAGPRTLDVVLGTRPDPEVLQRESLLGKAAPDFAPRVVAGDKLGKLSSLRGQVVLIDFFATWCGPCRAAMPHLEELHKRHGKRGLRVVGISTEEPDVVAGAAARFGVHFPLVADGDSEISARYRVYALPTVVVVDRHGVVHSITIANHAGVDRAVMELLAR